MEIKNLVDVVSKEHNLKKEVVLGALTKALEKVVVRKNPDVKMEVTYNESTDSFEVFHYKTVVESEPEMLDEETEINFPEAQKIDSNVQLGDELGFPSALDVGRISANVAKQVMMETINLAQQELAYAQYLPLKGTIVQGIVQRVDRKGALVTLGKVDGYVPEEGLIPRETLKRNQSYEFYLEDVVQEKGRVKITLSRSAPEMTVIFFKEEVPEVAEGEVQMKLCAREAGIKSKYVVDTQERYNPVAVCIGTGGHRIQKVKSRLGGEHVDVCQYTNNTQEFVKNLLGVPRLKSYEFNEETEEILVTVEPDYVARAIGPRGVNVRLSSLIVGYTIKINNQTGEETNTASSEGSNQ